MEKSIYLKEEKLYQAFQLFDTNDDGCITAIELKEVLGSKISYKFLLIFTHTLGDEDYKNKSNKFWDELVKEADLNEDGKIDYSEFLFMMQNL